jgi:hypothetical protein
LHRAGDEAKWWNDTGIDPMIAARDLWVKTHFDRLRSRPRVCRQTAKQLAPKTQRARGRQAPFNSRAP